MTDPILNGAEWKARAVHDRADDLAMAAAQALHGEKAPLVLLLADLWGVPPVAAIMELWGDPLSIDPAAARLILRERLSDRGDLGDLGDLERLSDLWEVDQRSWTCGVLVRAHPSARVASPAPMLGYDDEDRRRVMDDFRRRKDEAAQAFPKRPERPDPLAPEAIAAALAMFPEGDKPPAEVGERFRGSEDLAAEARGILRRVGHPWDVVREYFQRVDGGGPLDSPDRPNRGDLERILRLVQRWAGECEKIANGEPVGAGAVRLFFDGMKCLSIPDPDGDPVEILTELAADTPKDVKVTTAHRMVLDQRFAACHESGRRPAP